MEIRAWVGNLGKYNEGELVGEWVTFPIDEDEQEELCARIGINESYEEIFIADYDGISFGEYASIDELSEYAEKLAGWNDDLFEAVCEYSSDDPGYILDRYDPDEWYLYPDIQTDSDLGYYYAFELDCIECRGMEWVLNYFDTDAYGRDIRLETEGGFTSYGWLERR